MLISEVVDARKICFGSFVYRMQMKHIVEPLFVSHCILVQYCFLSFVSIILRHLCPVHEVRALVFKCYFLNAGYKIGITIVSSAITFLKSGSKRI